MMRSLWISKSGMDAQQTQLDHISNNLANSSTNGYKRSHAVFEDLIYQNLRQTGAATTDQSQLPTGLQVGLGVRTVATSRQFSQGALQQTTNPLDLAVQGKGFFPVQLPDGSTGYTRDGSFKLSADGTLVTNNGYTVGAGIRIPTEATGFNIAADGKVTYTIASTPALQPAGEINLVNFVNPAGLEPRGQNIFTETTASGAPTEGVPNQGGFGSISQGFLETSNVNVVEELVSMIQTQRAYELNSKAIQTSDQMLQKLAQL